MPAKATEKKPTDNGTKPPDDELVRQRTHLLAQIGERYLMLDAHRAQAEQCLQQIQQLRGALAELEASAVG